MCPIAHVPHHPCPPSRSIHYYGNVPITHVSHCLCAPLPYSHVDLEGTCHISHIPHHSCSPSPMCPITLPLVLMCLITLLPCRPRRVHATLPICPITPIPMSNGAHRWWGSKMSNDFKLSKRCQMSKNQISWPWRRFTKKIDIMMFTHIDVNFDVTYDGN